MVYLPKRLGIPFVNLMPQYLMYCRKSSEDEERQIISNESQEDELTPIVERDGLLIRAKIREEASAKLSGARPLFKDMINQIRQGGANAILCWHLNRLSRNAGDAAALVELMDEQKLLEIRTPSQTFRNTPGDKFLIILFCGQAKLENDNKGIDVERGLRKKANMGWYPGVAPTGYLNDKTKNRGERDLYNDPDRFALIKRMWGLMLAGAHTPPEILRIANTEWGFRTRRTKRQGGTPLSISALYHIFHNPFYYGWFEYPKRSGNWHEGKHEPMVTKEEFDRVQALLGSSGQPRPSKHRNFAFTGLLRCGDCRGMITAEEKHQLICPVCKNKFVYSNRDSCPRCATPINDMSRPLFLHYTYYHCARWRAGCRQRSIEGFELERQIVEQLGRIQISAEFKEWAFRYLEEIQAEDMKSSQKITQSRERAYAECVKRLESLVKLKTSPENADGSLLSDEEYAQQRRTLLEEKTRLRSPVDAKAQSALALERAKAAFELARSIREKFKESDSRTKKEILATVGSNLTLMDKTFRFEAAKPFSFLDESMSGACSKFGPIEPNNGGSAEGRNAPSDMPFSSLLRDMKDVRTFNHRIKIIANDIYRHFKSAAGMVEPHCWN